MRHSEEMTSESTRRVEENETYVAQASLWGCGIHWCLRKHSATLIQKTTSPKSLRSKKFHNVDMDFILVYITEGRVEWRSESVPEHEGRNLFFSSNLEIVPLSRGSDGDHQEISSFGYEHYLRYSTPPIPRAAQEANIRMEPVVEAQNGSSSNSQEENRKEEG
ncbi:hypothetical protein Gotri_006021 [Gossypium trilobum]|uniref:Uncharacterized protein n=1 Tax=Gossypium trilobum TaxID=34281 RepID=A0A7J9EZH7_9ROSI|nr:hypothetical protein [Gossypium trilobum]